MRTINLLFKQRKERKKNSLSRFHFNFFNVVCESSRQKYFSDHEKFNFTFMRLSHRKAYPHVMHDQLSLPDPP